jgi:hypothetical protein
MKPLNEERRMLDWHDKKRKDVIAMTARDVIGATPGLGKTSPNLPFLPSSNLHPLYPGEPETKARLPLFAGVIVSGSPAWKEDSPAWNEEKFAASSTS